MVKAYKAIVYYFNIEGWNCGEDSSLTRHFFDKAKAVKYAKENRNLYFMSNYDNKETYGYEIIEIEIVE